MARRDEQVDVIVVGAGSAALEASIAASQHGAERILILEKAPEPEFGGNPRFSASSFRWVQGGPDEIRAFLPHVDEAEFARMQFRVYTEEDFHRDLRTGTRGRLDARLQQALVEESNAAVHWLRDLGMEWEPYTGMSGTGAMRIDGRIQFEPGRSIHPRGGGIGQLEHLRRLALEAGAQLRYESKVAALHGTMWRFEGVRVEDRDGAYDVSAPVTILCSGGFQANPEARARYLGPNADRMKVRGSRHNTGEVLQMALAMGAGASGHWQTGHSSVVDAQAPDMGVLYEKYNRYCYPYGISVNTRGERFFDEGANLRMLTYFKMGWITLGQPDGVVWQIFDQKVMARSGSAMFDLGAYHHAERQEAGTLAELAAAIGVDAGTLERTVGEYNAAVRDEVPFDPSRRDGRSTAGLSPPKSNWANALDEPPFVAFPVTAALTFTFGGLHVNADAQVLNTSGDPIQGLYASGDVVGLFYHGYVGSTGQTRNVVFSRRAAAHALR